MPFMIGREPIRRTLGYLQSGRLHLKDSIQILSINYNTSGEHHEGARDFVFWHLPQVQYKNPRVQCITFKNMTPSPFVKCYYQNGSTMLIDIDSRSKSQILEHLIKVVGKPKQILDEEAVTKQTLHNVANFGVGCARNCICTVIDQVPCSGVVPLPKHMRGKNQRAEE